MKSLKMLAVFGAACMLGLLCFLSSHLQKEYNRSKISNPRPQITIIQHQPQQQVYSTIAGM